MTVPAAAGASKDWVLAAGSELRFEVPFRKTIEVRVKAGTAEYFGTELGREATYTFSGGEAGAIFSWQGCTLAVAGECTSIYVADETAMDAYINIHAALQQQRERAGGGDGPAPRVMVVGPEDGGKTALVRILVNYAVRMGSRPLLANLDPMEALFTVPGTVSVLPVTKAVDIEAAFMNYAATSSEGPPDDPLVWQFGHEDPEDNAALFNELVDRVAVAVDRRMEADREAASSGLVVDTHGFGDVSQNHTVHHAIEALRINTLLVVGNERMYSLLSDQLGGRGVAVVKLARSGGAVERSARTRQQLNARVVHQYFYGLGREPAASFSTVVNFSEIRILRVGEDAVAPSSTLPLGEDRKVTGTTVQTVDPDESLIHSLLAVTDLQPDAEDIVGVNVIGFVNVTKVEMDKSRMLVLSPVPGRLPKQVLLYGNSTWMETT
ncbi:Cleavage polyadenylation factor subunit clp1 [Coemansia sp. RSA 552]|nr:Cleavage polyadenylation factor subunit clp1 [Coemansia sp. RSA 552]